MKPPKINIPPQNVDKGFDLDESPINDDRNNMPTDQTMMLDDDEDPMAMDKSHMSYISDGGRNNKGPLLE